MVPVDASILKDAIGFFVKQSRRYAANKLKDGDVMEQKLHSWVSDSIRSINLKLDAGAKSDLVASLTNLKNGLKILVTLLVKDQSRDDSTETLDEGGEAEGSLQSDPHTAVAYLSCITSILIGETKDLQISNLEESEKKTLSQARKYFTKAREEATKASGNDTLHLPERVLAMNVRLTAAILENDGNLSIVSPTCLSCLEDLHGMPEVRKNFSVALEGGIRAKPLKEERRQIISAVCRINRLAYDVTKILGGRGLLLLPCIKVRDKEIDPLRDSRVAGILSKQNMDHCCLTRSFGQQEDEEQRNLKSATGIATNSLGQLLVIDEVDGFIKLFDTTGGLLSSFSVPPQERAVGKPKLKSIDTDRNDCIYVLQVTMNNSKNFINEMFVFKKPESDSSQSISLCKLEEKAKIFRVMHDQELLLLGVETDSFDSPSESLMDLEYLVHKCKVFNESGDYRAEKEENLIGVKNLVDMLITSDNDAVILDSDVVYMIKDCKSKSNLEKKETERLFKVDNARAIAYDDISNKFIIVSHSERAKIPSQVLIYNKDGKFDRSIHFEVEKEYGIEGVSVTRDGVICISAHLKDPPKGKVIVL